MVFSSQLFLLYFLPLTLAVYYLLPSAPLTWRNLWLVLTGYAFYGWAEPRFIVLMFATTTLDWGLSLVIARNRWCFWRVRPRCDVLNQANALSPPTRTQKTALGISVVSNLSSLAFFKYFNFGLDAWNQVASAMGFNALLSESTLRVVLPLGISFYTFQALSYIIDVYRRDAEAMENFVDFSCFVSMFPHLVAGPILKFSFLADQLRARTVTLHKIARGAVFLMFGLAKKVLLANSCGKIADAAFDAAARSCAEAWSGAVAYALQIYFDFSGYSDMAIGLGLFFGFTFARNFNAPYSAVSLSDFWRRWHISLSTWLREYLYIPLGGNRRGEARTYLNLFVTMLLGGLWHGASWNFLLWGALHGGALAAERAFTRITPGIAVPQWLSRILTLGVVLVGWVFFRAATLNDALKFLGSMAGLQSASADAALVGAPIQQPYLAGGLLLAVTVVWCGRQTWDWCQSVTPVRAMLALALGAVSLVALLTQDYNPFIYFIF